VNSWQNLIFFTCLAPLADQGHVSCVINSSLLKHCCLYSKRKWKNDIY